jgi:signal transduction histidine kinase/CheY-like chemotaxis protein
VQPSLQTLILLAWSTRYRDPAGLKDLGRNLIEAAHDDHAARAWGWAFASMGHRAAGQGEEASDALSRAENGFDTTQQPAGQRLCRALRALPWVAQGRGSDAVAAIGALGDWLAPPAPDPVHAHAAQFVLGARAMAHHAAGQWDDALRDRYAGLHHARSTGDAGAITHALADLASLQADLSNAEDALALADEALEHGERAGQTAAWSMAVFNRLAALLTLERHAEAARLADDMHALVPTLHPRNREAAWVLLARASLYAGDAPLARQRLASGLHDRIVGHRIEWTATQAEWLLHQGDPAAAAQLCEDFLASEVDGPAADPARRADGPDERLRLHRAAATAHERLGDSRAALQHARREQALYAEVVGRSARARRVALEIEHRLAQERWQREQAQRRQAESEVERQRLDDLNRALEAANAAKTRFLAAASHDLRQPVQALALNMAALEHEAASPAQADLVQRMGRSLAALGRMFDVLLDISRLDAGIVATEVQVFDLRPLLLRLRDDGAAGAAARGLHCRLHLPPGGQALRTSSDPVLLERCLRNLLDNAIKYTSHGGVLLALRKRGDGWRVQIHDTGIGMPPEVVDQAFDEFYQADNAERDRNRGLGLGLSIVRRLAGLLDHRIGLRSTPGRGTVVRMDLPRVAGDSTPSAADDPQKEGHPAGAAATGLCLAVIDDDSEVRDGLAALLNRWGHRVLAGSEPRELLHAWQAQGRPMVNGIVSDLRLRGGLDGVHAVQTLRRRWGAGLPALVITGDVAPERLQRLRDSALPWLPKPVMPMRLRSWLAALQVGPG